MLAINFLLSIDIIHAFWILLTETKVGLALNVSQWFKDKIGDNCTKLYICEASWLHFDELGLKEIMGGVGVLFLVFINVLILPQNFIEM